jgi:GNAT superfamily N-acetyltransferase
MLQSAPPASGNEFSRETAGEDIYVAITGETVSGLLTIWRPQPFIHNLIVDRGFRRQGIGTLLLNFAVAQLTRPIDLKCGIHNRVAQVFYEKYKWQIVERVTDCKSPYIRYRLESDHNHDQ